LSYILAVICDSKAPVLSSEFGSEREEQKDSIQNPVSKSS